MYNRLVSPTIDYREGMDVGIDGTYDKEDNGRRYWLSAADITINIGVAVDLWSFLYHVMSKTGKGKNAWCQCALIQD